MEKYLIMCRSMTHAQRSQRLLERNAIASSVIKAPAALTRFGCGYALVLRRHGADGIRLLKDADLIDGKIYGREGENWRELPDDLS